LGRRRQNPLGGHNERLVLGGNGGIATAATATLLGVDSFLGELGGTTCRWKISDRLNFASWEAGGASLLWRHPRGSRGSRRQLLLLRVHLLLLFQRFGWLGRRFLAKKGNEVKE
jgi:hypothetical protein